MDAATKARDILENYLHARDSEMRKDKTLLSHRKYK